jgi:hypothetical protein
MNARQFKNVYRELIEENPLAVRAVLKILAVEFTAEVNTLSVTCDTRPRLLVNLDFVSEHCRTEAEVKALVCHEFLHVLLRHTDRQAPATTAEHLALDAVINAIIHRTLGPTASALMSRYYADARGPYRLLRPPTDIERKSLQLPRRSRDRTVLHAWSGLYEGRLVADDIRDLAESLLPRERGWRGLWLGNHDAACLADEGRAPTAPLTPGEEALRAALETALKSMNGSGVFRSPCGRGLGAVAYTCVVPPADSGVARWLRETYDILKRHLAPDSRSRVHSADSSRVVLPVLSPGDRRAALRALWSPFLPDAHWNATTPEHRRSAQVYLDVSGSMDAEMPHIVRLLGRLKHHISSPFWAFSTVVAPARIEGGRLVADTTGGTSMTCVLEHIARTRPGAAVVVTDGYIEPLSRAALAATSTTRLHVIVTRDGTTEPFGRVGLPYSQLGRLPQ